MRISSVNSLIIYIVPYSLLGEASAKSVEFYMRMMPTRHDASSSVQSSVIASKHCWMQLIKFET